MKPWECPRCSKVNASWVMQCACQPNLVAEQLGELAAAGYAFKLGSSLIDSKLRALLRRADAQLEAFRRGEPQHAKPESTIELLMDIREALK